MSDEKSRILQMVRDGKISVEEGVELLDALDDNVNRAPVPGKKLEDRFLRVRVDSAKDKVNVNIPLSLLRLASHFGSIATNFIPDEARREMAGKGLDISKIDFEELVNLIEQGLANGKLVDIESEDPVSGNTRVEVYVE
ncbi:MAG: hypothetical protein WC364_11570 [Eubacteriales bacterium]